MAKSHLHLKHMDEEQSGRMILNTAEISSKKSSLLNLEAQEPNVRFLRGFRFAEMWLLRFLSNA